MYAVTSIPLDSRTRATLRSAEFGFLGVMVLTTVQTPRFCGQPCMAGCFGLLRCGLRGALINWLIVGIRRSCSAAGGSPDGKEYVSGRRAAGKARHRKIQQPARLLAASRRRALELELELERSPPARG